VVITRKFGHAFATKMRVVPSQGRKKVLRVWSDELLLPKLPNTALESWPQTRVPLPSFEGRIRK
jgi:hypothetical protein